MFDQADKEAGYTITLNPEEKINELKTKGSNGFEYTFYNPSLAEKSRATTTIGMKNGYAWRFVDYKYENAKDSREVICLSGIFDTYSYYKYDFSKGTYYLEEQQSIDGPVSYDKKLTVFLKELFPYSKYTKYKFKIDGDYSDTTYYTCSDKNFFDTKYHTFVLRKDNGICTQWYYKRSNNNTRTTVHDGYDYKKGSSVSIPPVDDSTLIY